MSESVELKEKSYSTKEVADQLAMGVTTVRKYAQFLEKAGYVFTKTKNNARIFKKEDINKIKHLKELRENPNITVKQATNVVMGKAKPEVLAISPPVESEAPLIKENQIVNDELQDFKKLIEQQNELISSLIKKIDHQEQMLNKWLNERDKDLMRTITEKLETQKLIAATVEEELPKRSFLGKILGK